MITIRGLVKRFAGRDITRNAVNGISFEVPEGSIVHACSARAAAARLTTLRMIAGLERPDSGEISIAGGVRLRREAKYCGARQQTSDPGMVFQLPTPFGFQHMTVFENVSFPLTVGKNKPAKDVVQEKTERALELVGLTERTHRVRRRRRSAGGQQQQAVALACALWFANSAILLLDRQPLKQPRRATARAHARRNP